MVSATTATSISSYVLGISRNKRDDDAVEDNNALAAYKYTQRAAGRSRKAVRSHRSWALLIVVSMQKSPARD